MSANAPTDYRYDVITKNRFLFLKSLQIWWPRDANDVGQLLSQAPVISVMQCDAALAQSLMPYAFRCRPFHTSTIDLSLSEDELWRRLGRSTRKQIRKAERLPHTIVVNRDAQRARDLINDFIGWRRYRSPLSDREWQTHLAPCDVFQIRHHDDVIAADLVLTSFPRRARSLLGGTVDRDASPYRAIVGALNRLLFWYEINHYKERAYCRYDLGGIVLDTSSPLYPISRFKLEFGGEITTEYVLHLAGNPALRLILRALARAKFLWSRVRVSAASANANWSEDRLDRVGERIATRLTGIVEKR